MKAISNDNFRRNGRAGLFDFNRFFKKLEERFGVSDDFRVGDLKDISKHPCTNPLIYSQNASRRMEGLAHIDIYNTHTTLGDFIRSCGFVLVHGETSNVGGVLVEWGTVLDIDGRGGNVGDRVRYTTARILLPKVPT